MLAFRKNPAFVTGDLIYNRKRVQRSFVHTSGFVTQVTNAKQTILESLNKARTVHNVCLMYHVHVGGPRVWNTHREGEHNVLSKPASSRINGFKRKTAACRSRH